MQPGVGVFGRSFSDTCSIRPPKQNWVLADTSELKGQALLGERPGLHSFLVETGGAYPILQNVLVRKGTVAHTMIQP